MTHHFSSTIEHRDEHLDVEVIAEIDSLTMAPKDVRLKTVREADSLDTRNLIPELSEDAINTLKFDCIADYEGEEKESDGESDDDSNEDEEEQD